MKSITVGCILMAFFLAAPLIADDAVSVNMANGIKIGEVSSTSAIIWTRLTKHAERNVDGKPFFGNHDKERKFASYDDLSAIEGSVPGAPREVRISYWPVGTKEKNFAEWVHVDDDSDFTRPCSLSGLVPGSRYNLLAEGRPRGSTSTSCKVEWNVLERCRARMVIDLPAGIRLTSPHHPSKWGWSVSPRNLFWVVNTKAITLQRWKI